ncbi:MULTISPECIES: ABC transporter substrate-binding protein [unclassified Actinotalea]|uniref:ABC transporter substrate-binding protein n=1 Tax=unclassified Actinotalea TaxID=2638618 RepID=UPI0015F69FBF|nr:MULTISPECIES: extracellular solute-binding protein [unclassified Actinotalea]
MLRHTRTRQAAAVTGGVVAALLLAACGSGATPELGQSSEPEAAAGDSAGGGAVVWAVESSQSDTYVAAVERWNADHPDAPIELQLFPDNGYKDKLRVALGAGEGPTMIYSWGGGGLEAFVEQDLVESLSDLAADTPEIIDRYLPATLGGVTFDGEVYGVPINNMQPVVLLYNKDVFEQVGAEPPATWDDLMDLVPTFTEAGVAPLALAGQSKWPQLPYLAYLVDRVGGPEVWDAVAANEPDAWSDPAVLEAVTMIQDLVEAGGFVENFSSISYESGAADALLYTDKAAMLVMLSQAYSNIAKTAPEFAESGSMGYVPFPAVDGGAGDPANLTGNPSNYWSITTAASDEEQATALAFLEEQVMNEEYTGEIVGRSAVPGVTTAEDLIAESDDEYPGFVFDLVAEAPHFQLSLDQALSPAQGEALKTALDQVFLLQITPEQFAETMNATIE